MSARIGRRLMGVAFIGLVVGLVALSLAFYLKVFSSPVTVTLQTDRIGNQLQAESDVKVRGVIVGQVSEVRPSLGGAEVILALDPEKTALVPGNVSARLTPKTLFGERFVDLVVPDDPSPERLGRGDVITQDRSETAIELERVLDNLLPLLQAVEPQKLAATLGAIDQALSGRGERLGATLVELHDYVSRLNPALPDLRANLAELADATLTLDRAAPDLLDALAGFTATSRTLVEQRANLDRFFSSVTGTSGDLLQYLAANRDNLIGLAETSRPTLELLAEYSPATECFLRQMAGLVPLAREAFGEGQQRPALHVTLEVAADRGKYVPNRDEPELIDERGPRCYEPVAPPGKFPQYPGGVPQDGAEHPPPPRGEDPTADAVADTAPQSASGLNLGIPNSPQEAAFIAAIKARSLGVEPHEVPQWAAFLLGPTVRGAEVSLR
jgi:phospholipid/cholesterol/gamma-HCH transport system substrate-binding protein